MRFSYNVQNDISYCNIYSTIFCLGGGEGEEGYTYRCEANFTFNCIHSNNKQSFRQWNLLYGYSIFALFTKLHPALCFMCLGWAFINTPCVTQVWQRDEPAERDPGLKIQG